MTLRESRITDPVIVVFVIKIMGVWFGCGGRLTDFRVGTWDRGAASSSRHEAMVGSALVRASALSVDLGVGDSVGRTSPLGRVFDHHIRVMGGCVIWVRWEPD